MEPVCSRGALCRSCGMLQDKVHALECALNGLGPAGRLALLQQGSGAPWTTSQLAELEKENASLRHENRVLVKQLGKSAAKAPRGEAMCRIFW